MTNIAHSTMSGSNLHENKGVASATDNTVATASSGATVWQKLTASHLTTTGNSFGSQLFHVREQQTSGTAGGTSTATTWTKRSIATSVTNEITSASLASNQITLPAGTYDCSGWACFFGCGAAKLRLRDITSGTTSVVGLNGAGDDTAGSNFNGHAFLSGRFTLSGTKVMELQYYVSSAQASTGLGNAVSSGEVEVYSELKIWKIA